MAFRWRANNSPTWNADLLALWFSGDPDQCCLETISLWFFSVGGGGGPAPCLPSGSAHDYLFGCAKLHGYVSMMAREIKQYHLTQRYDNLCKTFGTTDRHRQNCFYMYMLSSISSIDNLHRRNTRWFFLSVIRLRLIIRRRIWFLRVLSRLPRLKSDSLLSFLFPLDVIIFFINP